jgi:hypothetical protein
MNVGTYFFRTAILFKISCLDSKTTLGAPTAKKAKTEGAPASLTDLPFDIAECVRTGSVDKLKVDDLKQVSDQFESVADRFSI